MTQEKLLDLLNSMTIEEKAAQMVQLVGDFFESGSTMTGPVESMNIDTEFVNHAGSVISVFGAEKIKNIQKKHLEKSNIPLLFMADVIHGYRTIYPIPLAQGCSFDPELVEKLAEMSAKESAVSGLHVTFSPMADLTRDPRWGRVMEGTGEDTYLNSCMAAAAVKGYQGNNTADKEHIAACVKHFAAYGAPVGGRDYNTVDLSKRTLYENYLPAYKAAIDAGAMLVMTSFNSLDGIPATGNQWLMRKVLRQEMDFDGVLISDWGAIHELVLHGVAENDEAAADLAIHAGVDIDMMSTAYYRHLLNLVKKKRISERMLNEACLRILELKNKLGLFENPFGGADAEKEKKVLLCPEHRQLARKAVSECSVLLENQDDLLPLNKKDKTAFIGPYVDEKLIMSTWAITGDASDTATIKETVKLRTDIASQISFAKGCEILDPVIEMNPFQISARCDKNEAELDAMIEEAVETAADADQCVLFLGEHPLMSGEASSRAELKLGHYQIKLLQAVSSVNPNISVVLFAGRPLDLRQIKEYAKSILLVWLPGTEGAGAIVDMLYGEAEPTGRLSMSIPYSVGQIPVFYNDYSTGRPFVHNSENRFMSHYLDIPNEPLYPFGYGRSYTKFSYSEIVMSKLNMKKGDSLFASVEVTNKGIRTGTEIIQLYIRDVFGSVIRPKKELKGFKRIRLNPGETKKVVFEITEDMLKFYNADLTYGYENGKFEVYIGSDSTCDKKVIFKLEN